jgi:hypothetical protein
MAKLLTAVLMLAIFAALIVLAASAWRRRRKEQDANFGAPAEFLEDSNQEPLLLATSVQAQYVATTIAGEPLNRVTAHGLGFRGRATVSVGEAGILIERRGERSLALSSSQISGVVFTQAVIDRAVEKDGLVAINWRQDQTDLTTVLRFNSAADRNLVLQASPVLTRKAI